MTGSEQSVNKQPNKPLLPKITNDEIDLEIDDKRDQEIKNDRPPHHN
ncbi:MAG: hypothetical protein WCJ43_01590 [Actinomycetes bacterium]|jgi:hypothetical protein